MKYDLPVDYTKLSQAERRRVREQYITEQNGKCIYCGSDIFKEPRKEKKINKSLFPINFFDYKVHLHHCHITGMTKGAVHSYCNAVLWQYHGE